MTASIIAVLVSMAFDPSMQISLLQCLIAMAAIAASYVLVRMSRARQPGGAIPARSAS
ncbi:hypothetical protein FQZ97_819570 [compost metagenome]